MPQRYKFYAVKRGHRVGVFTNWGDVLDATDDFDAPVFRGFHSFDAANAWLAENADAKSAQKKYEELIERAINGEPHLLKQAEALLLVKSIHAGLAKPENAGDLKSPGGRTGRKINRAKTLGGFKSHARHKF